MKTFTNTLQMLKTFTNMKRVLEKGRAAKQKTDQAENVIESIGKTNCLFRQKIRSNKDFF